MSDYIVYVHVSGIKGTDTAIFDEDEWNSMSAAARVFEIHEQLRHCICGFPFTVISTKKVKKT